MFGRRDVREFVCLCLVFFSGRRVGVCEKGLEGRGNLFLRGGKLRGRGVWGIAGEKGLEGRMFKGLNYLDSEVKDQILPWIWFRQGRQRFPSSMEELVPMLVTRHVRGTADIPVPFPRTILRNAEQLILEMTESTGKSWRTGSLYALEDINMYEMDSENRSSCLVPAQKTASMRTAYFEVDGLGRFVCSTQHSDGSISFIQTSEVNGSTRISSYGVSDGEKVRSSFQLQTKKCCPFCLLRDGIVCECPPSIRERYFDMELKARQQTFRKSTTVSGAASPGYFQRWMSGRWVSLSGDIPVRTHSMTFSTSYDLIRNPLTAILQRIYEEVLQPTSGLLSSPDSNLDMSPGTGSDEEQKIRSGASSLDLVRGQKRPFNCVRDTGRRERVREFKCESCPRAFFRRCHLNDHVRVAHSAAPEYVCVVCKKQFGMISKLKRHVQTVHENVRNYQCQHCPNAYKDKKALRNHVIRLHDSTT